MRESPDYVGGCRRIAAKRRDMLVGSFTCFKVVTTALLDE